MHMHIGDRLMQITGISARLAGRLPWKKQMALAALFIGTPFILGNAEYGVLNLVGLGIGALLVGRVIQSRRQAEAAKARQATATASTARRTR